MEKPTLSIGIPVYNGGTFLEELLRNLQGQTTGNFEIVICDNVALCPGMVSLLGPKVMISALRGQERRRQAEIEPWRRSDYRPDRSASAADEARNLISPRPEIYGPH